jgi:hypothetical protein
MTRIARIRTNFEQAQKDKAKTLMDFAREFKNGGFSVGEDKARPRRHPQGSLFRQQERRG